MEKTGVEWLVSEIQKLNDSGYEFHPKHNEEIIKQAKEREKKQSIDFACVVMFGVKDIGINLRNYVISKYKETFKSE